MVRGAFYIEEGVSDVDEGASDPDAGRVTLKPRRAPLIWMPKFLAWRTASLNLKCKRVPLTWMRRREGDSGAERATLKPITAILGQTRAPLTRLTRRMALLMCRRAPLMLGGRL